MRKTQRGNWHKQGGKWRQTLELWLCPRTPVEKAPDQTKKRPPCILAGLPRTKPGVAGPYATGRRESYLFSTRKYLCRTEFKAFDSPASGSWIKQRGLPLLESWPRGEMASRILRLAVAPALAATAAGSAPADSNGTSLDFNITVDGEVVPFARCFITTGSLRNPGALHRRRGTRT